ncbi:MAG: hypothetical protein R3E79_20340 [Caldilineaceae bacterium]
MAFSDFKTVEQVISKYPLAIKRERFLPDVRQESPAWFITNLNFALASQAAQETEQYFRESFIFPFLQLVWQQHTQLKLWINRAITVNDLLYGEADYLVSHWIQDKPITQLVNTPLLAVAEAKRQDFDAGWGQCLAEMIACQKMNKNNDFTVYGIVSTGQAWEFGKLYGDTFTRDPLTYTIVDPDRIYGILNFVFSECESQLNKDTIPL